MAGNSDAVFRNSLSQIASGCVEIPVAYARLTPPAKIWRPPGYICLIFLARAKYVLYSQPGGRYMPAGAVNHRTECQPLPSPEGDTFTRFAIQPLYEAYSARGVLAAARALWIF